MRFVCLVCALFFAREAVPATAVWIDTDPSMGAPWREVDDAFALVLAFHSPELRIAGVSTTYGNANLRRTTTVARDLVRRFGEAAGVAEGEVKPGAASPRDPVVRTEATEALACALRKEPLTYIALGPLTNLAAFLALYPELEHRITRVILVGGRAPGERLAFGPNESFRIHDANVFKDPTAMKSVLATSRPLLVIPITIAPQLALTRTDMQALRRSGVAGRHLVGRSRAWLWFWTSFVREEGGLVCDVLAILPAIRLDLLQTETRFAELDRNSDLVVHAKPRPGARPVRIATGVTPAAKDLVMRRWQRRASK